jgi:hypothetical protein
MSNRIAISDVDESLGAPFERSECRQSARGRAGPSTQRPVLLVVSLVVSPAILAISVPHVAPTSKRTGL